MEAKETEGSLGTEDSSQKSNKMSKFQSVLAKSTATNVML